MKTLGVLLSLVFTAALNRADIVPSATTTGWTHTFGPSVSNHFVYTYAQPLVGEFSSFGSNYTINRYPPNVFTVITTTSRTNYGHDSAEIGSALRARATDALFDGNWNTRHRDGSKTPPHRQKLTFGWSVFLVNELEINLRVTFCGRNLAILKNQ